MRLSLGLTAGVVVLAGLVLASATLAEPGGALSGFTEYVRAMQASLQQALVAGVRRWREAPDAAALAGLGLSCFLYGVFHAVGPGHGKAVLATYAATANVRLGRVLMLSAVSALTQATVAVILVGSALLVIGTGARWVTSQAERVLEPASYAAIAGVGLWLAWSGLRAALPRPAPAGPEHHHHHHHHHHHEADGACCGGHHPPAAAATGEARLGSGLALAVGSGLRPCTGSLLVLVLCFGLEMWTLGIVASYAIGVGTALTVAALAAGAHAARHPAAWLASAAALPDGTVRAVGAALRVAGGAVILLLGATLLHAALKAPAHPLL